MAVRPAEVATPLADGFTEAAPAPAAGKVEELNVAPVTAIAAVVDDIDPGFSPSFGPKFVLVSELALAPLFNYNMEIIIVDAH